MISKLIRDNIKNLKPYSSARDEFQGADAVFMDANENPYGIYNRYPDPHQKVLKAKLSKIKELPPDQIFIGNGSDEVIDLALRIFCEPGKDKIMICSPTYGMYEVAAHINDLEVVNVPLTSDFQLDVQGILETNGRDESIKIIFLCSPNNPTGNDLRDITRILEDFNGIVFVDEAYIDFSDTPSFINQLDKYPNLIVSQTFSKARGLAGARVGLAFSSVEIIGVFDKVKPPYNVSALNQQEALKTLIDPNTYQEHLKMIKAQRAYLNTELSKLKIVKKIYPTDANFILFEVADANRLYDYLVKNKVIIRNRNSAVQNTLRASVGLPEENKKLIKALKNYEESTVY